MRAPCWTILLGAWLAPAPAQAAVRSAGEAGFAVESSVDIAADADTVYALLGAPDRWWDGAHSYSGDAANLHLDPGPGAVSARRSPAPEAPPAASSMPG